MCGFVGFAGEPGALGGAALKRIVTGMADSLATRGPDDSGVWVSPETGVALGHRRLSVIDLSPAGRQPMPSASGRTVIVYNGEVYNFPEIRRELEAQGVRFRGRSDTEAVVEACEAWGAEVAAGKLIGMFAFALWDTRNRTLTLVRDRLGIKPLYWGRCGGVLFFGSQPKAFFGHPSWRPEIDRDSLAAYLRFGYVPAPRSIFRRIEKLEPGCLVEIASDGTPARRRYWDLRAIARDGAASSADLNDDDAVEALDALLRDAVKRRMVADVPLGALLSGGIDSSTVLALMQAQSSRPVKSFSIGFDETDYDEAHHAKRVAEHLGTDHTELYVSPDRARELLPAIPSSFDEPFADVSQLPTCLLSELTRRHVTVALSGDGGDELFAGYTRYAAVNGARRLVGVLPRALRGPLARVLRALPADMADTVFRIAPRAVRPRHVAGKARTLADLLDLDSADALYLRAVSMWPDPDSIVLGGRECEDAYRDPAVSRDFPHFMDRMQFLDAATYLPDDILAKVDRASMAVSLEVRVPLLDHRVAEFAWRLPRAMKMRNGVGKWLLRRVLDAYVPRRLTDRPKTGFGVPIGRWLAGPLREWAEDLLAEDRMRRGGYLDPAPVRDAWNAHRQGRAHFEKRIWNVLMFESWRDSWGA